MADKSQVLGPQRKNSPSRYATFLEQIQRMIRPLILLLISSFCCAQQNEEIIITKDSDTTYWAAYLNKELKRFDIRSIVLNNGYTFRLSTYGSMVEIQNTESNLSGSITFFVQEVDDSRDEERIFKKRFPLSILTVQKLFNLIDSSQVSNIPSDKLIKDWQYGFDGITYFLESKRGNSYSFKSYWSPTIQDVSEAKEIQYFVETFYKIVDSESFSVTFTSLVPFRSYSFNGGSSAIIRPMTQNQYKDYRKRMRARNRKQK